MTITFNALCSLLQSIENITAHPPRLPPTKEKESVRQVISNWFSNHRRALDSPDTSGSAILSALLPHRRKDRVYGLQTPLLARKLARLLNFNHGQKTLLNGWKNEKYGDFGVCIERAMKPWDGTFSSKHSISIIRVDRLLTQLAAKYRFSDAAIRSQRDWHVKTDEELKEILVRLESWEAKWLVRLVLRDYCTILIDEDYVYEQYHFLLPDLLRFQNDFDAVFGMLRGELSCYPAVPGQMEEPQMRIEAAQKLTPVVGVKVGRPNFKKAWSFKHCFQMLGDHAWAAENKYDGEYCEIHIDLTKAPQDVKIYSKNGKDATMDRKALHATIREALRVGRPDCAFKSKCIVLGEMVLYSDKEQRIMPFSKIRKHISRSGSFIGTLQDSLPHEWEHLMLVYFDVLMVDDEPVLRHCLQERRNLLRDLVQVKPGRSMRSEWSLLDFRTGDGITDLKEIFARNLASRQEGLVLKPLHAPYFPLLYGQGCRRPGYFIKLKKDYLGDMGGERDLGDFAVIGASFEAQVAPKSDVKPLYWTHFHLGCCNNKAAAQRSGAKPVFQVVATVGLDQCIPKPDLKYLNIHGYVRQAHLHEDGQTENFGIIHSKGLGRRMAVAFRTPFVAEILGSNFEKVQNETFEMLRHPRVQKLHSDRTWEDCVTLDDLERMAEQKWEVPNVDKLDGNARDVALLVSKYVRESQASSLSYRTTQDTVETTPRRSEASSKSQPSDAIVQETQLPTTLSTYTTASPSTHYSGSTQGAGTRASRQTRVLVREDTIERSALATPLKAPPPDDFFVSPGLLPVLSTAPILTPHRRAAESIVPPASTAPEVAKRNKRDLAQLANLVSPPAVRRRLKGRTPLKDFGGNGVRHLGAFAYDSQDGTIHIYAKEGLKVQVHAGHEHGECSARTRGCFSEMS
ncbi:ATP dependent DNA ligase domain-containing protein [Stagonosporopsis vannaccii]|nr:ATP dependent DNA ligase domain-containing protein [Stagonosporopsis vannaccii]